MKIAVFSDSHGDCRYMVSEAAKLKKAVTLNYIVHLGDLVQDAKFLQEKFPEIPVLYVYGNCDFTYDRLKEEKEFELGGKNFFIMHGHTRRVKSSLDGLKAIAGHKDYDVLLYGHTHEPHKSWESGTYIINPGSVSDNRNGGRKSYCVIDITGDILEANIVYV